MANAKQTQRLLDLAIAMWRDPKVRMYQDSKLATDPDKSIFLAGPSSRQDVLEFKWRVEAVHYLRQSGFQGIIYVPEPRDNDWSFKETFEGTIVAWESERLLGSTIAFFWIPRHEIQLPGRVTNTELGFLCGMAMADPEKFKDRVIVGAPPDAWKVKSEKHWAGLSGITFYDNLQKMCELTVGYHVLLNDYEAISRRAQEN